MNTLKSGALPIVIGIIIVVGLAVGGAYYFLNSPAVLIEETKEELLPPVEKIGEKTVGEKVEPKTEPAKTDAAIVVTSPKPNELVSLPFRVSGYTTKGWSVFEGQAGMVEVKIDGKATGVWGPLMIKNENWMDDAIAGRPLYFETQVGDRQLINNIPAGPAVLAFVSDDPSGLGKIQTLEMPIRITVSQTPTMPVTLYFHKDHPTSCAETYAVTRTVPKTVAVADISLKALFAEDLTALKDSYLGVSITNGVAKVNFRPAAMTYLDGPACTQQAFKAPIEKTLLQFNTVKDVQYSIDGKVITEWNA